jgi:hypothetical protein
MALSLRRSLTALLLLAVAGAALADQSFVQLQAFPAISVADGHSTTDISATVRDSSGRAAPAGTEVVFSSNIGTFRENVVVTSNGIAHGTLVAGNIAGIATITATASTGGSPTVLTYEFVKTRAELSSAREYVELDAPRNMQYDHTDRIISAAAPHFGVILRYRDIEIDADDLEYDINSYVVKARKAKMKMGKTTHEYEELNVTLNAHHAFGTTTYKSSIPTTAAQQGMSLVFLEQKTDGTFQIAQEQEQYGLVEVHRDLLTPYKGKTPDKFFTFTDISASPSIVSARRATVYPRKEIQFQRAEIYVANAKIIRLPLFVVNFTNTSGPMVTDGLISITDNQIGINYPQWLLLKPGLSSDFRFHMGDQVGRDYASDRGAFLDYELNWDRGDDMQGGLTFGGIGREDWSVDLHQYWHFDDRSSATAQFSLPSGQGFFGSGSVNHEFTGFSANVSANHSQTFTGIESSSQSYGFDLTTDPKRIAKLPVRYSYGLTATQTSSDDQVLGNRQQGGEGVTARATSDAIPIDKSSLITASLTADKLYGENELAGIGWLGVVNLSHRISSRASMLLTYNYTLDGFNDAELGHHLFSLSGNYHAGKAELNLMGSKSVDVNRMNLYADMSYHLSNLWRLSYSYTENRILGSEFLDWNFGFDYRIGWREVGLLWSESTHRVGIQLLGATF